MLLLLVNQAFNAKQLELISTESLNLLIVGKAGYVTVSIDGPLTYHLRVDEVKIGLRWAIWEG